MSTYVHQTYDQEITGALTCTSVLVKLTKLSWIDFLHFQGYYVNSLKNISSIDNVDKQFVQIGPIQHDPLFELTRLQSPIRKFDAEWKIIIKTIISIVQPY